MFLIRKLRVGMKVLVEFFVVGEIWTILHY